MAWNIFNFGPGWILIRFSFFYLLLCTLHSYCRKKLGYGPNFCLSASYLEDHKSKLPVERHTFGSLDPSRSIVVLQKFGNYLSIDKE
jgi:hypothetical protein